ncbi:hypothetical protein D3C86_1777070 [compost metagenome]
MIYRFRHSGNLRITDNEADRTCRGFRRMYRSGHLERIAGIQHRRQLIGVHCDTCIFHLRNQLHRNRGLHLTAETVFRRQFNPVHAFRERNGEPENVQIMNTVRGLQVCSVMLYL